MPTHKETKTVNFTSKQMFDLVADIDKYYEFLPWCNSSKVIKRELVSDNLVRLIADLEIGYKNLVYVYRSDVLLNSNTMEIQVNFIEGPFKYLVNNWLFTSLNNDNSKIDFYIDFELNVKFFNFLISQFFDKAFNKMVGAFESRANQIYTH